MPEPEISKLKSCRQIRYKEAVTPVLGNFNHPLPASVPDKNLDFFMEDIQYRYLKSYSRLF